MEQQIKQEFKELQQQFCNALAKMVVHYYMFKGGDTIMADEKKSKRYEILFSWRKKNKTEDDLIGPVLVQAKTERAAIAKAAVKVKAELVKADLFTLDVDVRTF